MGYSDADYIGDRDNHPWRRARHDVTLEVALDGATAALLDNELAQAVVARVLVGFRDYLGGSLGDAKVEYLACNTSFLGTDLGIFEKSTGRVTGSISRLQLFLWSCGAARPISQEVISHCNLRSQ